jgi:8-oxo-dGTP pyrophosphatase MutT (NUDIX family)
LFNSFDVSKLKNYLELLPEMKAWVQFAPPGRFPLHLDDMKLTSSAVAVLLFPNDGKLSTVLLLRTSQDRDKHSGQISFPGGKADDSDKDLLATALRELWEETGITLNESNYIGTMSKLAIPVSGFEVTPIVLYLDALPDIILSEQEAVSYHILSLDQLSDISNRKIMDIRRNSSIVLKDIPYIDLVDGTPLWGATAMILAELLEWMKAVEPL